MKNDDTAYRNDPAYHAAAELLKKCIGTSQQRARDRGGVSTEWAVSMELLNTYLTARLGTPVVLNTHEYGVIVNLMKVGRLAVGDQSFEDHYLDAANYMALSWGVVSTEGKSQSPWTFDTAPGRTPDLS